MKLGRSIGLACVLLAVSLAYANSFNNGFHFDDFHTVVDNPAIRELKNIPRFFTDASTFSVLPANRSYRPVVSTSLAIDYALGSGYSPLSFHRLTFLIFLLQVALLYAFFHLLLNRIKPAPANQWLTLIGAAWFGLHPAMAETMNYVIQRGDLYCTLGCVAALYLFARLPHLRKTGLYLVPLVFALLSKPPAAIFPLLLLLFCFFFEPEVAGPAFTRWRRSFLAALPSVAVTAVLLWLQSAMTPKTFLPSIVAPWQYRLTQPYVWLRYFAALFLPLHLNVDTDLAPFQQVSAAAVAGLIFLAALLIAIWYTARRPLLYPIAFGLLWFLVTQLPTSLYPLSEVENDHRMFFSFPGLMLSVIWATWLLLQRLIPAGMMKQMRPVLAGVTAIALCIYGYGVHERNRVWHDEESLWRDDILKSPHNGRGLMIYGLTQMKKGAYAETLGYFEQALQFTPNYATLEINLAIVNGAMADQGDTAREAEANRHFLRAISLQPDDDTTHAYYGRWLAEHGHSTEALAEIDRAIELNSARLFQRDLRVEEYARLGDTDRARQSAQDLLALAPDDAIAQQTLSAPSTLSAAYWVNLSLAQYRQQQYAASLESARRALTLDRQSAEAWNNIAANEEALHRWDEAIDAAQQAIALKPGFQLARNNLVWSLSQKRIAAR